MEEKVDIVALGELLIDFTEAGHSQGGRKLFEQNPGGAPANLLTVASHFGYRTSFIGKVGNDMHGKFLKRTLQTEGINTDAIVEDPDYFTTLAFVEIGENGERNFSFARKPGADTQLKKEELDQTLISGCRIFHFGSLSLTDEPAESATIEAVKMAKAAGVLISYDPNYRPSLWKSKEYAVKKMKSVVELVDVMKVSDEESILLTGAKSYEQAAEEILAMGPKLVAITLGEHGVLMATKSRKEIIKAFQTHAVDTTGAGDSFWGGVLCSLLSMNKNVEKMEWEEIKKFVEYIVEDIDRLYLISKDRPQEVLNELGKKAPNGIGPVYQITLLYFISKGQYPIYDRFAYIALQEIKNGAEPFTTKIEPQTLPNKTSKKFKSVYEDYIEPYMQNISLVFGSNYNSSIEKYRNIDRALWVYGHAFK